MASNDVLSIKSAVELTLTDGNVKTSKQFRDAIQKQVNESLKKVSGDLKGETLVIDPSVKLSERARTEMNKELGRIAKAQEIRVSGRGLQSSPLDDGPLYDKNAHAKYMQMTNEQLAVQSKVATKNVALRTHQAELYQTYKKHEGAITAYVANGKKVAGLNQQQVAGLREYSAALQKVNVAAADLNAFGNKQVKYWDPQQEASMDAGIVSFKEAQKAQDESASSLRQLRKELDFTTKGEKERTVALKAETKATESQAKADKMRAEELRRQRSVLNTSVKDIRAMSPAGREEFLGSSNKSIAVIKRDMDALRKAGKHTTDEFLQLQIQLDGLHKRRNKVKQVTAEFKKLGVETEAAADKARRLQRFLKSLQVLPGGFMAVGKAADDLKKPVEGLNRHLSQGSLLIKQFFRYALGYGALFRMLTAVQSLVKGVVDLQQAMLSIQAITAATDAQMMDVSASIKQVATETKFTTAEVAKAAQVLAQAGVDPDQINSVLNSVAHFAAGTETAIQTAADLVSTMRNVFKELDDMTIADKLTQAVNISKLTGDNLKIILGISAQVAKQFNLSSDQYLAAVATLRNAGLKASTVATGLRQGLLELFSPDTKTVKALKARYKQLGEDLSGSVIKEKFFEFTKDANPLLSVLRELNRLGFTKSGKETLARGFDVRAQNAITALINSIDELEQSEAKLSSSGSAAAASQKQMEGLRASLDNLGAAMTVLASDISEGPIEAFEDLVDSMTETIKVMDDLEIASKSLTGESGLADVLSLATAGGVIGALGASTPKRRAILGIGGAALGGVAGTSLLESGTESGNTGALSKASEVANSFVGIWAIGKVMGGVLKAAGLLSATKVEGKGKGIVAGLKTGIASLAFLFSPRSWLGKASSGITKVAAVAKDATLKTFVAGLFSLGGKMLGFVGWLYLAYEALDLLWEMTVGETPEQELKKRTAAMRNRQKTVISTRKEYDSAREAFNQYRVSSDTYSPSEGSEALAVENLKTVADGYNAALGLLLKDTSEEAVRRVDDLFKDLRKVGDKQSSSYKDVFAKIENELAPAAAEYTDEQLERIIDSRLNFINQLKGKASGLYSKYENLVDQEIDGKLTELDEVILQAIRGRFASVPGLASAMQGKSSTITPDELVKEVYGIFKDISEDLGHSTELSAKKARAGKQALRQATETLRTWSNTADLNVEELRRAVDTLLSSITEVSDESVMLIENIERELQAAKTQMVISGGERRNSGVAKSKLKAILTLDAEAYTAVAGGAQTADANLPAIAQGIDEITQTAGSHLEGLSTELLERNEGVYKQAADVIRDLSGAMYHLDTVFNNVLTPGSISGDAENIISSLLTTKTPDMERAITDLSETMVTLPDEFGKVWLKPEYDVLKGIASRVLTRETRQKASDKAKAYIPDTTSAEKIYNYDNQIRELNKSKNYGALASDSASNPIVARAAELTKELTRAMGIARAEVTKYVDKELGGNTDLDSDSAESKKLHKLELAAAKAKIALDKVNRDKELQLTNYSRKVQEQTLKADRLALDGKISANAAEIKGAVIAGNATGVLTGLQEERAQLAEMRRDLERRGLKLEGMSNEQIEKIMASRETRDKAQEIIDSSMEELSAMRFRMYTAKVTGEFNTMNHALDSYRDAIDYIATDAEKIESFKRQIKSLYPELVKLKSLKQEAFQGAVNPLLSPEERAAHKETFEMYTKQLDQYQKMMGKLVGEYERLAITANFARQMVIAFDVRSILADFENLQSDIKELGKTIRADFVGAIDELGPALTNALINSKSVTEAIRQVFFNMFSNMAEHLAANLVNNLMQEMLTRMQASGIRNLFGNLFGAMDIAPIGSEAAMGDALKTALPGADPAVLANTAAITANTAATTANTGAVSIPVGGPGGIPIGQPSPTPGNRILRVTDDKDDLGAGLMQESAITNQHLAGLVAGEGVTAGLFTDLITGLSAGVTSIVTAIFSSSAAESGSGAAGDLLGAVASAASGGMAKIKSYAGGGRITGPGTGTSDSILGAVINAAGKVVSGVRVSDGESILTAKATDFLGENFINAVNSNRMAGLATGGVIGTMSRKVDWGDSAASFSAAAASHTTNVEPQSIKVINTVNERDMANAMNGPFGEKVILNVLRANRSAVQQVIR